MTANLKESAPRDAPTRHRKIGPYRILGELGRGGMARVYRGVHETLQREVAIKELLPDAADKETRSRFRREALALAAFRHEHIVTLYDLVEKNDSEFMILEFVDGPTLQSLLRDGPLPPEVAAVVGAQLASALEHAHFGRIIHRDIKPANVMLSKLGAVKLMDFGIAKDEGLAALTQKGMSVGTPSYMSPEQVTGAPLDARTDLFSLGVVLYECLSGTKPFVGNSAGEVFAHIRDGKFKPLHKVVSNVPVELLAVVRRAMQVDVDKRYFDAAQLRRDLEYFLARHVSISHTSLLVAFLRNRNKLTESEALARITQNELAVVEALDRPAQGRRWLGWSIVLALGTAAGLAIQQTQHLWMPLLRQLAR